MDCDVLGGTATDDDHRSVDESRSAALQQSDEAPIDGHSQSQSVPSLLKIHFYHLSWPT